jgi:nucleoporin NUP159
VAFSADENYLVISAESGGGLGVYDVQSLLQGNTTPTFELSTNSTSLRALVPNPNVEKAELFAVVTTNGELMMANLKTRQFLNGAQGQIMMNGVSCVSWSTRGKQLVAGLGNGTCSQITPEGDRKGEFPRPPDLQGDEYGMFIKSATLVFNL